jgi:hypothetical protein
MSAVKYGVIVAILVVAGFIAWPLLFPTFDERYVRSLLARHDADFATARLVPMDTEEFDGTPTLTEIRSRSFIDSNHMAGAKEIELVSSENGSLISGQIVTISSTPSLYASRGNVRSWKCAFDTFYNLSTEETGQYLYIGVLSNYMALYYLNASVGSGGFDFSNVENAPGWNESWGSSMENLLYNSTKAAIVSEVHYYNPDEREAFDERLNATFEFLKPCEEAAA